MGPTWPAAAVAFRVNDTRNRVKSKVDEVVKAVTAERQVVVRLKQGRLGLVRQAYRAPFMTTVVGTLKGVAN